ncbi:Na(+)/H(+) antiporter subunit D [Sneathiella litorea]|uniref:Na(+)/H(+) antiporter subunit D n=1 Tax=Sneathiella litorea TaxID=2606216 RepID=A0A6L8W7S3_9PROT|nr:Na(+)/H(+) antiporter subunit D [Sneathiella litorea]MZR30573.1 Na(+)/H(+) antiporter subunit D [Sneathiella litorea]
MIEGLNPGLILILGALLVPLTSGIIRSILILALPVIAVIHIHMLGLGTWGHYEFLGLSLEITRIDPLSRIFGTIFCIAAFMGMVYAVHVKDTIQHFAALIYIGSAIGAVFAGDMITLFAFWELTAISSVFLIWASRTERAYRAGMRYLIIQVTSGVVLLGGIILYYQDTGSIAFDYIGLSSIAGGLILLAFGIKSAFPLLHNWVQDAYPEATVTGTVILSAFTTKLAIYALARAFPGTDILIPIGGAMIILPIVYVVLENDLRRVLAYSLNSQLGYMVIGVGIGSELALNGTAAHVFVHIMYKSLLFMCMGAVLFRAGTVKVSELGGLYKSMPVTTVFCLIGAISIAAFPLTGGFVSKAMIQSAALNGGLNILWPVMLFACAGIMDHSGLKVPFFTFFSKDRGIRVQEAPINMLIAMGIAAFFCIGIGVFPGLLFDLLPYAPTYDAYSFGHIVSALQLLFFTVLAFMLLIRYKVYPMELRSTVLDFDWFYRVPLKRLALAVGRLVLFVWNWTLGIANNIVNSVINVVANTHGNGKALARTTSSSMAIMIIVAVLGFVVVFFYG